MNQDDPVWQALLTGDKEACSQIYKLYAKQMYLFGMRFTSNNELIEDAIHDVFVKIYNNEKLLNKITHIKVYLFIALKNTLLNNLKKPAPFQFENYISLSPDSDSDIQVKMIEREQQARYELFISRLDQILTDRQRQAIYYRFVEELSLTEISKIMRINLQSVKNTLQASIKKIREAFPDIPSF